MAPGPGAFRAVLHRLAEKGQKRTGCSRMPSLPSFKMAFATVSIRTPFSTKKCRPTGNDIAVVMSQEDALLSQLNPPFRAEHIGSLLRPKSLLDQRGRFARGEISREALAAAEDAAIKDVLALQERVGLKFATDGEFRRRSYHSYFYRQLGDLSIDTVRGEDAKGGTETGTIGKRGSQPVALIRSRVQWTSPINVSDFKFIAGNTRLIPKITIPGPCALHFRGGNSAVLATAYTDLDQFWDDTVQAFGRELKALAKAGCRYVQIDETAFAKFGDPQVQAALKSRGDDWSALIDKYVAITNRCSRMHRRACGSACIFAAATAAASGTRKGAMTTWPSGYLTRSTSNSTSSNTTRRAPAHSRRCASCRPTRPWCSALSRPRRRRWRARMR